MIPSTERALLRSLCSVLRPDGEEVPPDLLVAAAAALLRVEPWRIREYLGPLRVDGGAVVLQTLRQGKPA